PGQSNKTLGKSPIRPQFSVYLIRHNAGRQRMTRRICEEACFAEALGKIRIGALARIWSQAMECAARMIDDDQVARVVEAKAGDLQRRIDQFLAPRDLGPVVLQTPNLACHVI